MAKRKTKGAAENGGGGERWLGVDCGGTKTRLAWLPAGAGDAGHAAGVQPAVQGVEAAAAALVEVLRGAGGGGEVAHAVAALAGAGDAAVRQRLDAALRAAELPFPVAVVGDVLAAAAAALAEGPGLLIWSGTGSFAIARDAAGRLHRAGGRGYLLGDQGSGYDFVRRAAQAVVLAADGLGPQTALTAALAAAFGCEPAQLGAALQRRSTGEVAAQLPAVLDAAAQSDAVAGEVLTDGVHALVAVAGAAVRRAQLSWEGLAVAFGGGVLLGAPAVRDQLQARVAAFATAAPRVLDADAGALGAAMLARAASRGEAPLAAWVQDGSI